MIASTARVAGSVARFAPARRLRPAPGRFLEASCAAASTANPCLRPAPAALATSRGRKATRPLPLLFRGIKAGAPPRAVGTAAAAAGGVFRIHGDPPAEYRRNVGICLVNEDGLAFAAQRVDDPIGYWQMPQGGVDEGEGLGDAAVRELREETGVLSVELMAEVDDWVAYDFPPDLLAKMADNKFWRGFKGQAQKWYLFRLTGPDSEVDISGIGEAREFSNWRWAPLEALPGAVIPFKKAVYEAVVGEFAPVVRATRVRRGG